MLIVFSRDGLPIRLTDERWEHIVSRRPALIDQRGRALETLAQPDMIQQGDAGELLAIRFYEHTPLTSKFLVVVYREVSAGDGFILTAFFARRPSAAKVTIWTR